MQIGIFKLDFCGKRFIQSVSNGWHKFVMLFVVMIMVSGCETTEEPEFVSRPIGEIYHEALAHMKNKDYELASQTFDEVERQHPYSAWAAKAQLMAAYSDYLERLYDEAVIALDRYIELHPSNRDVPYAYYLKGLSYYEQISDVSRDQKMTDLAMSVFQELILRFPQTKYARDARLKVDLTFDHLAGKEMEIGRYYLTTKKYLAAINRFQNVVKTYQTTTHVAEALHRLTEAYLAMGVIEEAQKTASVLGHNYPGSEWYIDSYKILEGKDYREGLSGTPVSSPWYEFW